MKRIIYKLIFNFFKIFGMNKSNANLKLQNMNRNLENIKTTIAELKNAEVFDEFLIANLEQSMNIIQSTIEKMINENDQRDDSLKHIKKF